MSDEIGGTCGQLTPQSRHLLWEADSHTAGQEIIRLLWNSNVRYRVQKSPH